MKTEIVGSEPKKEKEINWSKPMLVKSKITGNIIHTTGTHNGNFFEGMCVFIDNLESDTNHVGMLVSDLTKQYFIPITEPITIKFTPEN